MKSTKSDTKPAPQDTLSTPKRFVLSLPDPLKGRFSEMLRLKGLTFQQWAKAHVNQELEAFAYTKWRYQTPEQRAAERQALELAKRPVGRPRLNAIQIGLKEALEKSERQWKHFSQQPGYDPLPHQDRGLSYWVVPMRDWCRSLIEAGKLDEFEAFWRSGMWQRSNFHKFEAAHPELFPSTTPATSTPKNPLSRPSV